MGAGTGLALPGGSRSPPKQDSPCSKAEPTPALDPLCPPLSPRTGFWFGHKHMGLPARGWSKPSGCGKQRLDTPGSTSRSSTRLASGFYPPRMRPIALPSPVSRYNTARPPLPTEHSASCEGKVETPAPLRERRHRQHRTASRRSEGLIEPRSGVLGLPLPLSRRRPGTAKAASTGSGTGRVQAPNSTPRSWTGPAPGPSRPTGGTQSRADSAARSPGTGIPRDTRGCGMPGGTRAVSPAAQPRDPPD